ncbi:hypothetical protein UFOVP168_50 [uncultured Caudovirales phage]|uniref:Uncharacterized protein n=1 Tax=uncultured Caudovirales phage TaxID=2100421 RepID=A0A6J7WJD0_9CAUD|nr:hypothetical protein UFOVP168_50 [uncultured Caudovirales phage]
MTAYTTIIKTATEVSRSWSNADVANFHYHNPNGLVKQKWELNARITAAVEAGKCKSGAIFAYGTLNDYAEKQIIRLASYKRVSSTALRVAISMMERDIATVEAFLASLEAAPAPVVAEVAPEAAPAPEAAQEAVEASDDVQTCKCCDRLLNPQRTVMLEMSISKRYTSTPGLIPESQSQGWFPFGLKCAAKALASDPYEAPVASQEAAADTVTITLTPEQARAVRLALRTRMSLCITQELSTTNPAEKSAWDSRWSEAHSAFTACGGSI